MWVVGAVVAVLVLVVGGLLVYANVGRMAAEAEPLTAVEGDPAIELTNEDGAYVLRPAEGASNEGLIFIPGAKVDPLGYASMLAGLVRDGVTVVITQPTLGLAILDLRGPAAFTVLAPDVDEWAIGGHSLGGVRACQLAGSDGVEKLILVGSYCATDLSGTEIDVLSISGTEDGLSTPEKIEDAWDLLPADAESVVIEGANHASFGSYGPQSGDGEATIAVDQVHAQVDEAMLSFLD